VPTEGQLSVVIATTHPWPNSQECLEILLPQIAGVDAEILLADSSGIGLPEPVPEHLKSVRWIKAPGASVFHLRAIEHPPPPAKSSLGPRITADPRPTGARRSSTPTAHTRSSRPSAGLWKMARQQPQEIGRIS
jgi:hypothetical protein